MMSYWRLFKTNGLICHAAMRSGVAVVVVEQARRGFGETMTEGRIV